MSLPSHLFFKNNDQQRTGESETQLRYRKSEFIKDDSGILSESQIYEKDGINYSWILYLIIIIAIIALGVYGFQNFRKPSNPDQELIIADIITNSILAQLKEKSQLVIDEQYKELKQFYGKNFNQGIWNKIQDKVAQTPGVLLSSDKKKWFLE